ncbi:MAG: DMT family transporter [candidate division Zixibacteria bacterium]|jgi:drug/metabolite transporter (DMT)-like permease|nr:DMT family transporter [candidate division Zixibacteria bacterium]
MLIGESAALITAFCWSFGSILFTIGSTRLGSVVVNRIRLVFAFILLVPTNFILTGQLIPLSASAESWFWLGLSGIVGFTLGDTMLFQAFVMLGTRITMLIMSLVPVIGAFSAWVFLGERLSVLEIASIAIVIGGISSVVILRHIESEQTNRRHMILGIFLALGGAMGQAGGLILSRKGMTGDLSALSANVIRVGVAMITIWLATLFMGKVKYTIGRLSDKKGTLVTFAASVMGPFLGVWMSLVAIKYAKIGVASAIMALPPILILPLVYVAFKEKVSRGAIIGTVVAVGGTILLFIGK